LPGWFHTPGKNYFCPDGFFHVKKTFFHELAKLACPDLQLVKDQGRLHKGHGSISIVTINLIEFDKLA
jgi:hypothetical protein